MFLYCGSEDRCAHLSGRPPESRDEGATQVLSRSASEAGGVRLPACWHAHSASASRSMRQNGRCPSVPQDQDSWFPSQGYHSIIQLCPSLPAFRVLLSLNVQWEKFHSTCKNASLFFPPSVPRSTCFQGSPASTHLFHRSIHPGCRTVPRPAAWAQTSCPSLQSSPAFPHQSVQLHLCGARPLLP